MLLADQRTAVVRTCRHLLDTGLVRGTSGNVSVRDGDSVAVSPTGLDYRDLRPEQVPVLDLTGLALEPGPRPTSELALHLGIYRARPDVAAIVHTHSVFATLYAVLGEPVPPVHYQLARAGDAVPVAGYARFGSDELAEGCVRTLGDGRAVLLANHGLVAVGTGLPDALAVAESVEYVAELAYRARLAGGGRLLDTEQLTSARIAFDGYGQR